MLDETRKRVQRGIEGQVKNVLSHLVVFELMIEDIPESLPGGQKKFASAIRLRPGPTERVLLHPRILAR